MAETNKIKLSDLLGTCLEFKQKPTVENEKKIHTLISQFQIATYIPLKQKEIILIIILNNCTTKDLDAVTTEMNLVVAKTIYGMLSYVVNLENDLEFAAFDAGAIDLLYEMEIIDNVLKFCSADYNRLEKMIEETMNFSNLVRLANLANLMAPENIDKFTQTILDMKTELTPERLDNLKSLASSGSPEWAALKETVVDEVLGRVMDKEFNDIEKVDIKRKKIVKKKNNNSADTSEAESEEENLEKEASDENTNKLVA